MDRNVVQIPVANGKVIVQITPWAPRYHHLKKDFVKRKKQKM